MDDIRKTTILATILMMLVSVSFAQGYRSISPDYCMLDDKPKYMPEKEISIEYPVPTKIAYLTFDDGPSKDITPLILDVLREYNIKATFFTLGKSMEQYPDLTRRLLDEGHGIGNHSYSHSYKSIYSGVDGFEWELRAWDRVLRDIIGYDIEIRLFRFPGGSHNKSDAFKDFLAEIGYSYYDWNALNGDSEMKDVTMSHLRRRTAETLKGQDEVIFLMHDSNGKMHTVDMLPELIHTLRMQGYEFDVLK